MRTLSTAALALTLTALSIPTAALAQAVANAAIHGVIGDSTGAVLPSAAIKAVHTDTGQVRSTVAASDGSFVLPNLPVGAYSIEATAPGFTSYIQSGIILEVGNNVLVNITMQVGTVTQALRVSANPTMAYTQHTHL